MHQSLPHLAATRPNRLSGLRPPGQACSMRGQTPQQGDGAERLRSRRRSSAPRPRCRGDRTCSCTLCTLHCRADCDASPATDRRPPCRSLPVRACRLPACPASVFACLLRGQAGQLRPCPDATHRDVPWRVAGVRHYRNSIEEPSHRMAHSASACPAAESAQCEGRHHGGTMMMASRWDPAAPA